MLYQLSYARIFNERSDYKNAASSAPALGQQFVVVPSTLSKNPPKEKPPRTLVSVRGGMLRRIGTNSGFEVSLNHRVALPHVVDASNNEWSKHPDNDCSSDNPDPGFQTVDNLCPPQHQFLVMKSTFNCAFETLISHFFLFELFS